MNSDFQTSKDCAVRLDEQDKLASYRNDFAIRDPDLVYFDGNSLGRLTKASLERARQIIEEEWGKELIRGWNKGWWESPTRVGEKIAQLIGAAAGEVIVGDTTSINLFKLTMAALALLPERKCIVTDSIGNDALPFGKKCQCGHRQFEQVDRSGVTNDYLSCCSSN